jgi:hypothetical protein
MFDFKNFIMQEQKLKGLFRQFQQEHPNLPQYVQKDMFSNATGRLNRKIQNNKFSPSNGDTVKDYDNYQYKIDFVKNLKFTKKPKKILISPTNLHPDTLATMQFYRFGYKRANVINDKERTNTQREIASKNVGDNQPVVFVFYENKYYLIEGWHRTQAILLLNAPEEDKQKLQNFYIPINQINFSAWEPILINAYIGYTENSNKQTITLNNKNSKSDPFADTFGDTIIN